MSPVAMFLFWLRTSFGSEDPVFRRMDMIRGARLDRVNPAVKVFSGTKGPSLPG